MLRTKVKGVFIANNWKFLDQNIATGYVCMHDWLIISPILTFGRERIRYGLEKF